MTLRFREKSLCRRKASVLHKLWRLWSKHFYFENRILILLMFHGCENLFSKSLCAGEVFEMWQIVILCNLCTLIKRWCSKCDPHLTRHLNRHLMRSGGSKVQPLITTDGVNVEKAQLSSECREQSTRPLWVPFVHPRAPEVSASSDMSFLIHWWS